MRLLRLDVLSGGRIPGISPGAGAALSEAASQCLARAGFRGAAQFELRGDLPESAVEIEFEAPTMAVESFWADERKAVEFGAEGIGALLIEELTPWTIVRRARIGTGFDYWLALKGERSNRLWQGGVKLELSGLFEGPDFRVGARVRAKLRQTERSRTDMPAVAMAIRFRPPLVEARVQWT